LQWHIRADEAFVTVIGASQDADSPAATLNLMNEGLIMRALLPSLAILLATTAPALAAPLLNQQVWQVNASAGFTSEIISFEKASNRLFVAAGGRVDVLNAGTGALITSYTVPTGLGGVNSVAASRGYLAVSVDAASKTDPGALLIFNTATGALERQFSIGAVPDMVTWSPDGSRILVANEGEPNSYGQPTSVNPEGSITIINAAGSNVAAWTQATADFRAFNGQEATLRTNNVRIFGPGATAAQDLEPEYIALSADGATAYVTLQENNALAIVDVRTATVTAVRSLGYKDHGLPGNGLDPSDRNGAGANIRLTPGIFGMYQPDTIASFSLGGRTFLATANEGDARDNDVAPGFNEVARVADIAASLDPAVFGGYQTSAGSSTVGSQDPTNIGRLNITTAFPGATTPRTAVYAYGARSFSIWDDAGALLWDSGDLIERTIRDLGLWVDNRSDDKGPEPEAVAVEWINGQLVAFVGLERTHNVLAFDMTGFDPLAISGFAPALIGNFSSPGLLRPEGISVFQGAGNDWFLAVAFEGDGPNGRGTSLFRVATPEPISLALFAAGLVGLGLTLNRRPFKA
jgi:hypothetical protein